MKKPPKLPGGAWNGLWLTLLLLLAACAGTGSNGRLFEKPRLHLVDLQRLPSTLLEQRFRLTLRVTNPNAYPLPIGGLRLSVAVQDQVLADGVNQEGFTVPARGAQEFTVTAATSLLQSLGQLARLLARGERTLDYRLTGTILVDLPLVGDITLEETGRLNLNAVAPLDPKATPAAPNPMPPAPKAIAL
ncbi:MAG: LEA type 2 family protein [Magnetococcales bacterium]|nr:LEA type 2 family protein [Magnetococcales bacterium]